LVDGEAFAFELVEQFGDGLAFVEFNMDAAAAVDGAAETAAFAAGFSRYAFARWSRPLHGSSRNAQVGVRLGEVVKLVVVLK